MSRPINITGTPGPVQTDGGTTYRIDTVHYQGQHIDRRVYVARLDATERMSSPWPVRTIDVRSCNRAREAQEDSQRGRRHARTTIAA